MTGKKDLEQEFENEEKLMNVEIDEQKNEKKDSHWTEQAKKKLADTVKTKKVIELASKGLSKYEIARVVEKSPTYVNTRLELFMKEQGITQEELASFGEGKGSYYEIVELLALKSALDKEKLQSATFSQITNGLEKLNKIKRLESNQSTENIQMHGNFKIE